MDDDALKANKQQLRRQILMRRDGEPDDVRAKYSIAAVSHLLDLLSSHAISSIGLFWPIHSEIDVLTGVPELRARGFALALPAVLSSEQMEFRVWREGDVLTEAGFGTMAPVADAPILWPQALVMPLAGFDLKGHRLGYGGGFYDRYSARAASMGHEPLLIGFAFAFQQLDNVPVGRYDQSLDYIVTDKAVRAFGAR